MADHRIGDAHLAVVALCFACDAETARGIADHARILRHGVRDIIVRAGDASQDTWLLLGGEAHAVIFSAAGQLVLIHRFAPGELFGAVAGAAYEPEEAEVVAIRPSETGRFRAVDFVMLVERHGCVAAAVMRSLAGRLHEATRRMIEVSTLSANGRVHAELLRRARAGDGRTIRPAPVLAEVALSIQSTRETVSRAINALERSGVIRRTADELVVVAPHRLEELIY